MGGCLLTVQQANHHSFDAVGMLGWRASSRTFRPPGGSRITYPLPTRGTDLRRIADQVLGRGAPNEDHFRFCFHWPDEDLTLSSEVFPPTGPTPASSAETKRRRGKVDRARLCRHDDDRGRRRRRGRRDRRAGAVGSGERDVIPDPWAKPTAYRGSHDITVLVVPRTAHMRNFALTRGRLWDRLAPARSRAAREVWRSAISIISYSIMAMSSGSERITCGCRTRSSPSRGRVPGLVGSARCCSPRRAPRS